jgi:hypothetical protein
MSAAMINVGLMRESRFPIRNVTAHAYACVSAVATVRVVAVGPRIAGSPLAAEPYRFALRRLFRTALCGDGEADHLK